MKFKNTLISLSIFTIVLCIVLGSLTGKWAKIITDNNIFYVEHEYNNKYFTKEDINELKEIKDLNYSYVSKTNIKATSDLMSKNVDIIGTNNKYSFINNIFMKYGSFFIENQEYMNVVVINEYSAWEFFGNSNAVGNKLEINNNEFTVIGVTENNHFETETNIVYMPFLVFENINKDIKIQQILVKSESKLFVKDIIGKLGYNETEFLIIDVDNYINIISQRPKIIIFILGIELIFIIIKYMIKVMINIYVYIKKFCIQNYLTKILNVFKNKEFIKEILPLLIGIVFIVIVIKIISFKLYLPDNFAINKINFEFLKNTYLNFMQNNVNIENFNSFKILNYISNFVFILALLCGIPSSLIITSKLSNKITNLF